MVYGNFTKTAFTKTFVRTVILSSVRRVEGRATRVQDFFTLWNDNLSSFTWTAVTRDSIVEGCWQYVVNIAFVRLGHLPVSSDNADLTSTCLHDRRNSNQRQLPRARVVPAFSRVAQYSRWISCMLWQEQEVAGSRPDQNSFSENL